MVMYEALGGYNCLSSEEWHHQKCTIQIEMEQGESHFTCQDLAITKSFVINFQTNCYISYKNFASSKLMSE